MKRILLTSATLPTLLRPDTALEWSLLGMPEFEAGMLWGEPRYGHPEGKVAYHVREVLDNIERIPNLHPQDRARLRLIAYVHDTFKYQEDRSTPRNWQMHHAAIATRFLQRHCDDEVVLSIIEAHDDAYYCWLRQKRDNPNLEHKSIDYLLQRVGSHLQLYYLFFKCDTQTGDKTQASVKWFEQLGLDIEVVDIPRF
jgi:HD domain